jgi:aspartate/methionine/tyrosine aminotransferase
VLDQLKTKAQLATKILNEIEGFKCNPVQGAMYAFPNIQLPQRVIDHAKVRNVLRISNQLTITLKLFLFLVFECSTRYVILS